MKMTMLLLLSQEVQSNSPFFPDDFELPAQTNLARPLASDFLGPEVFQSSANSSQAEEDYSLPEADPGWRENACSEPAACTVEPCITDKPSKFCV